MRHPEVQEFEKLLEELRLHTLNKYDYGAKGIVSALIRARKALADAVRDIKRLPDDKKLAAREPDSFDKIRQLCPRGPRRLWQRFEPALYADRVEGALMGRMAGCILGAAVELWQPEQMEKLARENGDSFPPTDYWKYVPDPYRLHCGVNPTEAFTRHKMNGVPADDDIAYTLLGLLVVEQYGSDFTIKQLGEAWLKYIPIACTAEKVALDNIKKGISAEEAGAIDNPYDTWIGAGIRADPWAYMAPGWPEKAAAMAWRDGMLTHRRTGVYAEMFFAAAISAAFAVDDPVQALQIGLTHIPAHCTIAREIRWALKIAPEIHDFKQARKAVEERFPNMHHVHAINNACLTIWGITIGRRDFTRVISETVAMGMDCDCTTATAGSIIGAVVGKRGIPAHWTRRFNNTIWSYLNGHRKFTITGVLNRFARQARRIHAASH
ncbi:MAG: ADP-ribosylglycohydrolase family protein [Candidatus Sumerlaeota bacterium]|nr:ADP-ribosylglycohydrolase family protein [Candidatus Sumerlaeota bacterium]